MKENTKLIWQRRLGFAAIATVVLMFAAISLATAQDMNQNYEVGDKIEVKRAEGWFKAVVTEVGNGKRFTIQYEVDGFIGYAQKDVMRPLGGAKAPQKPTEAETSQPVKAQADTLNGQDSGANKYKPGERVECDKASMGDWEKGTVMPFQKYDKRNGQTYRVRLDSFARAGMYLDGHECLVENIRPLAGAAPFKTQDTAVPVGKTTVDDENTVSADRAIMECPVKQTPVKNGAPGNAELFKKIIRCNKGEKPAAKGRDGAVTVDVTALQIGASRSWIYLQDLGGKPGTIIYPVKATFHYKTFYRSGTQVSQNWIRILNFYVNAFGEWEIGSEESVKMGETINVPRDQ